MIMEFAGYPLSLQVMEGQWTARGLSKRKGSDSRVLKPRQNPSHRYLRVATVMSGTSRGLRDACGIDASPVSILCVGFDSFWHSNHTLAPLSSPSWFCWSCTWSLTISVGVPPIQARATPTGSCSFLVEDRCARDGSQWLPHSGATLLPGPQPASHATDFTSDFN